MHKTGSVLPDYCIAKVGLTDAIKFINRVYQILNYPTRLNSASSAIEYYAGCFCPAGMREIPYQQTESATRGSLYYRKFYLRKRSCNSIMIFKEIFLLIQRPSFFSDWP
jgi:hypothetical protein